MSDPTRKGTGRRAYAGHAPGETRDALVASALASFGAKGYEATSVEEITRKAGVTKGAFYHYFESKEDILWLIHSEFVDHQLEAAARALVEHDDPAEQLRALFRTFAESVRRYQPNVTVFFEERRHLTGPKLKEVRRKQEQFDDLFRGIVLRGVEQGVFRRDLDPHVVYLGMVGLFSWMHHWYRSSGPMGAEQIADTFAELILDGLRAPATQP